MRKGQGAMEYLMTYGWALLVIIIVGAALFALGVLNPATYQQRRCTGFQYFTYIDQKLTASDYEVNVRNGNQKAAVVGLMVGTSYETGVTLSNTSALQSGDTFTIKTAKVPSGLVAGNSFDSLNVQIVYNVEGGITNNTDTAACTGIVA
ncbi:MAG: hypothetical protein FJY76_04125 [Candidatus Aenigmarchaeota archaeon]|nr:hypothetical protein [Candidatus Aenigmarchaeota archaeon]